MVGNAINILRLSRVESLKRVTNPVARTAKKLMMEDKTAIRRPIGKSSVSTAPRFNAPKQNGEPNAKIDIQTTL